MPSSSAGPRRQPFQEALRPPLFMPNGRSGGCSSVIGRARAGKGPEPGRAEATGPDPMGLRAFRAFPSTLGLSRRRWPRGGGGRSLVSRVPSVVESINSFPTPTDLGTEHTETRAPFPRGMGAGEGCSASTFRRRKPRRGSVRGSLLEYPGSYVSATARLVDAVRGGA